MGEWSRTSIRREGVPIKVMDYGTVYLVRMALPAKVERDSVTASYEAGSLELRLPKAD
jgi:HSP20 family molecular chaperone IbpA